jgi:hypothetical protein
MGVLRRRPDSTNPGSWKAALARGGNTETLGRERWQAAIQETFRQARRDSLAGCLKSFSPDGSATVPGRVQQ